MFNVLQANTEGPCLEVPSILEQYLLHASHLTQYKDQFTTRQVLALFRDFTSLLWLLHVRDKLSLKLRQKEKYLDHISQKKQVSFYVVGSIIE